MWSWVLDPSDKFSVKSAYSALMRVVEVRGGFNLRQCVEVVGAFKCDCHFSTTPSQSCVILEEPP